MTEKRTRKRKIKMKHNVKAQFQIGKKRKKDHHKQNKELLLLPTLVAVKRGLCMNPTYNTGSLAGAPLFMITHNYQHSNET